MKKFALGILSVFLIFGGLFLSACDSEVNLSISTEEVTIYTNDSRYDSEAIVNVSVENSSMGIGVNIVSGDGIVKTEQSKRADGDYYVTIQGIKSGDAEIEIYSQEDYSKKEKVSVHVNTILTNISQTSQGTPAKSDKFAVKGVERELDVESYFDLYPAEANIRDTRWSFVNGTPEDPTKISQNGEVVASINGNKLFVSEDFQGSVLNLKVTAKANENATGTVSFEVLENSQINSMIVGGEQFYRDGELINTNQTKYELKYNDFNRSTVSGSFVVNTAYDVEADLVVYDAENPQVALSKKDYSKYFLFSAPTPGVGVTSTTCNFDIVAQNTNMPPKTFYVFFKVCYKDFDYEILVGDTNIIFDFSYTVKNVEIRHDNNTLTNNYSVDVFSHYTSDSGYGYGLYVLLKPDDVSLDNDMFRVSVDVSQVVGATNPDDFILFYNQNGTKLNFTRTSTSSSTYTLELRTGTTVYVLSNSAANLQDVVVNFYAVGNQDNAKTALRFNLYHISEEASLDMEVIEPEQSESFDGVYYLSSNQSAVGKENFQIKINGLSTANGLTLKHSSNPRFSYGFNNGFEVVEENEEDNYIIVNVEVSLEVFNFSDSTSFWFEHTTGKVSVITTLETFVPMTQAYVENLSKSSVDVFVSQDAYQDFVLNDSNVVSTGNGNSSLAKVVLESGSTISLSTIFGNATLSGSSVSFKSLAYEDTISWDNYEDVFNNISINLNVLAENFDLFRDGLGTLMTINNNNQLMLTDNPTKQYIAVLFNGFDEEHKQITYVRFFAVESFYSVTSFLPNYRKVSLYTTETLSIADMDNSYSNISISLRNDTKVPTYASELELFTFESSLFGVATAENADWIINGNSLSNGYYTISYIARTPETNTLTFRITANSTNLLPSFVDYLKVYYSDNNNNSRETEIQIIIQNVKRVEKLSWLNQTEDSEIYLDTTAPVNSADRKFSMDITISPSDSRDLSLKKKYIPTFGSENDISVDIKQTSMLGYKVDVSLNTQKGDYGYLYLLPSDMVKMYNGSERMLVYKYAEDENGNVLSDVMPTPYYIDLNDLTEEYDNLVNGCEEFSNYFVNNDGEKVFYSALIVRALITLADGSNEETALRVYDETTLKNVNTGNYFYRIMNDITLHGWTSLGSTSDGVFKGTIFGKNANTTLHMTNSTDGSTKSQAFVNVLEGTIKDLTFTGVVETAGYLDGAGFVANVNKGTVDNVVVDVYFEDGSYKYSTLTSSAINVGGLVGVNESTGKVLNSYNFGMSINSTFDASFSYTGGIVGQNSGLVRGSGVEFYTFGGNVVNKISSNSIIGGIVGWGKANSIIEKSYAYAYPLETYIAGLSVLANGTAVKGAFIGRNESNVVIRESFAFLGADMRPTNSVDGQHNARIYNSYLSYKTADSAFSVIYSDATVTADKYYDISGAVLLSATDAQNQTDRWTKLVNETLSSDIWQLSALDSGINFGFMYLKETQQSASVDVNDLFVADNTNPYKSIYAGTTSGILFYYSTTDEVVDITEISALNNYNTISVSDLFNLNDNGSSRNLTASEARSLLPMTSSNLVSIGTGSMRLLGSTLDTAYREITVTVHSRMNFSSSLDFTFIIINALPQVVKDIDGQEVRDEQTLLVQMGDENIRTITNSYNRTLYLNGIAHTLNSDDYTFGATLDGVTVNANSGISNTYITVRNDVSAINLVGLESTEGNSTLPTLVSWLSLSKIQGQQYIDAIKNQTATTNRLSVYRGATTLEVSKSNLNIEPDETENFTVDMASDNSDDNISISIVYDGFEIEGVETETTIAGQNFYEYQIDSHLTLEIYWTKQVLANGDFRFNVGIGVKDENKHLIEFDYENLKVKVAALSQLSNNNFPKRELNLTVNPQPVDAVAVQIYDIETRQVRNSTLYMRPSENVINTVAPSSDILVAVTISPAFAKMTHFTLTYDVSMVNASDEGKAGTLSVSRMLYNTNYGYYIDTTNTNIITNGVRVNLTSDEKQGSGVYYFRVYVSSAFTANSTIKFNIDYYYENEQLNAQTINKELRVEYLKEATVEVEGSSLYTLSRGSNAKVTVTVALDQELYSLYLTNNLRNLTLTTPTYEIVGNSKVYTAYVIADVDATLIDGNNTGIFYVCATVERIVNNKTQEIKESRATVCLVDFAVEKEKIAVSGNGGTINYGGYNFDVFHAYVNATNTLSFDYPILPKTYTNFDANNADEVAAVEELMNKRQEFTLTNLYKDEITNYYINYIYNASTLSYSETSLIQRLYLVENFTVGQDMETNDKHITSDVASKIYNDNLGQPIQRSNYFDILEEDASFGDINFSNVKIVGKLTGTQLMKLQTTIYIQGTEIVWDYYFVISVEIWSDEETPTTIYTGEEFVNYLTNSERADDYILMADIELNDYQPLDTSLVNSLDGNGFTINLNSFKTSAEDTALTLALFTNVYDNTLLKNVRVNIYSGGQINVNIRQYSTVNIAGFAIENSGIIYNCEVVSYYDSTSPYMTSNPGATGLYVQFTDGNNTDPIAITSDILTSSNYALTSSNISGFVETNSGSIVNSRVGGEKIQHIVEISGLNYIQTENLGMFTILGQGDVAGFVNSNAGYISASFVDNVQIYNRMNSITSKTAGFALRNTKSIQTSYIEGVRKYDSSDESSNAFVITGSSISARGIIGGFVYENSGTIENSYSNIAIDNSGMSCEYAAGFVYINQSSGMIRLSYSACEINAEDINQMQFSGVYNATSRNLGTIESSYYYASSTTSETNQKRVEPSVLAIDDAMDQDSFYGFSFASAETTYDGIWRIDRQTGLTLVSANEKAFSNRYAVTVNGLTSVFYSNHIVDLSTMNYVNLSYGSKLNPIIIRSAVEFAKATGKATSKEISSFKEFYTNSEVFGNYRLVNDINLADLENESERTTLTTTSKTFSGIFDGNGFTISGIELGSEEEVENYGLFARLNGAAVMGLKMEVVAVNNTQANIVGTLAGTAINTRICAVELTFDNNSSTTSSTEEKMIAGQNVVGGLVGMVFGESKLSDISVSGVEVFSSYSDEQKSIKTNNTYTGDNLRRYVDSNSALKPFVRQISYAGSVAGYVDIYDGTMEFAAINLSYGISDYNVVTIRATDSVNIYAEVTGGLFGYVGKTTLIYDASLELDSPMSNSNPSYIISRNLYSGGLIGENYGGMFAVSASYAKELQDSIEEKENDYYSSVNSSNERGQISIFSYTDSGLDSEELRKSRANDPLFIGGLVGYMGGGYIYIGSSKLNVVANESTNFCRHTLAVGGIIGYVGAMANGYNMTYAENNPKVNLALHDVYASGDVSVANSVENLVGSKELNEKSVGTVNRSVGAGIIGAMDGSVVLGLKNVNALNYYSTNTNSALAGDKNVNVVDNTYTSDRHFTLIGSVLDWNNNVLNQGQNASSIYLVTNQSFYAEAITGSTATNGALTVGGYTTLRVGGNTVELRPFGFDGYAKASGSVKSGVVVDIDHIGKTTMNSMSVAYSTFNSFFIKRGWNSNYWVHTQDKLLPHIELHPQTNLLFWDYWNTDEIIKTIERGSTGNLTIVLRGKFTQDENDKTYVDIDLTGDKAKDIVLKGFSGKLVSYYSFTGTHEEATVKSPTAGGGDIDADVGIIMDHAIFEDIAPTATIQGITFYMVSAKNENEIRYQMTKNSAGLNNVEFKDIRIVLNSKVNLTATNTSLGNDYGTGLIANSAKSTTFEGIVIDSSRLISNNTETSDITLNAGSVGDNSVYLGFLVGKLSQESVYDSMVVSGVSFIKSRASTIYTTTITFDYGNSSSAYMGLYAGEISRTSSGPFTVGLTQFGNIDINISSSSNAEDTNVYVGAYAGRLSGVDNVSLISDENSLETNIVIKQNGNIKNLYAGLGFGIVNCDKGLTFQNNSLGKMVLNGGIYQVGDVKTQVANIGGLIGQVGGTITINGLSMNFNVGKFVDSSKDAGGNFNDYYNTSKTIDDKATEKSHVDLFEQNLYSYKTKHPYVIETSSDNNAIGGYVGYQMSGNLTISGQTDIAGIIDIEAKKCNVGGMVGKTLASTKISAEGTSTLDISVSQVSGAESTFNVGGMIGNIASQNALSNFKVEILSTSYNIVGNTISNSKNIKFGGVVGLIERTDWSNKDKSISIENIAYGGTLKIYENISGSNVTVGGIVGEYSLGNASSTGNRVSDSAYQIYKCKTYGDVFVMYPKAVTDDGYDNSKLKTYNFGGIVGSASYIVVDSCSSLMTSFNSKYREAGNSSDQGNYNVNAIVGASSEIVYYKDNKYSSGVNLAYQVNSQDNPGNTDCTYGGNTATYNGYVGLKNVAGSTTYDILVDFAGFENGSFGTKLNPNKLTEESIKSDFTTNNKSHGITWYSITNSLTINNSLFKELSNSVVVGNTNTIKFEELSGTTSYDYNNELAQNKQHLTTFQGDDTAKYGGLVNVMGNRNAYATDYIDFTAVSGIVMNLGIDGANYSNSRYDKVSFGGVVGEMYGNSIVYGVGVNGTLSVGGGKPINLGGLVGMLNSGLVQECYTDVDMIYRGTTAGFASGVANTDKYNSLIRTTYSSGQIETYVDASIYTFAYTTNYRTTTSTTLKSELLDVYSITQVKKTDALSGSGFSDSKTNFINNETNRFDLISQVVNGCNDVKNKITGVKDENIFALGYDAIEKSIGSIIEGSGLLKNGSGDLDISKNQETITKWYFTPYTNYGFASHGFGYLKNTSTYTRDSETVNKDGTYSYTVVPYSELISTQNLQANSYNPDWYLSVLNTDKFVQMISNNSMGYKYLLKYDVDLNSGIGNDLTPSNGSFALDGNMKTLTYTANSSLFNKFKGSIENLRIINKQESVGGSGSQTTLGLFANELLGGTPDNPSKLKNITVIGNISNSNSNTKKVGGVVGNAAANTTLENIEAVVNITNSATASITGGIVGYSNGANLSMVSNSGIVQNISNDASKYTDVYVNIEGSDGKDKEDIAKDRDIDNVVASPVHINSITGGLVGYMNGGTITESYNINSVLANYKTTTTQNAIAGGLVGYLEIGNIESSYNTGMVGVGNYKNDGADNSNGYSFAGGIFGYGEMSMGTVTSCFNDAKVEALGKGSTHTIYRKLIEGTAEITSYTHNPSTLKYLFTMVYNEGLTRKVFAYGIGYTLADERNQKITSSGTSVNNITNDGVIGQTIEENQTMVFERNTILDDTTDNLSYGIFSIDDNVYKNGVDSYGFTTRIYMKDKIKRAYLPTSSDNEILKEYYSAPGSWDSDSLGVAWQFYINGENKGSNTGTDEYWYNGQSSIKDINSKFAYNSSTIGLTDDDIGMACESEYYSSVSFRGYDEVLKSQKVTKLEGNDNVTSVDGMSGTSAITQGYINNIDERRKINVDSFVDFNVAGQTVAVVYNKNNIDDVYSPYRYKVQFNIKAQNSSTALTENSFTIVDNSNNLNKYVIEDFIPNGDNTYTVVATLYYNDTTPDILNSFSVQINYEKSETIVLAKNSVVTINGNTYILLSKTGLANEDGINFDITQSIVKDLETIKAGEARRTVHTLTFEIEGQTFSDVDCLRYATTDIGDYFIEPIEANGGTYTGAVLIVSGNKSLAGKTLKVKDVVKEKGDYESTTIQLISNLLNSSSGGNHLEYDLSAPSNLGTKELTFVEKAQLTLQDLSVRVTPNITGNSYRYDLVNGDGTSGIGATNKFVLVLGSQIVGFDGSDFIGSGTVSSNSQNTGRFSTINVSGGTISLYKGNGSSELALIIDTSDINTFVTNNNATLTFARNKISSLADNYGSNEVKTSDDFFKVNQYSVLGNTENFEFDSDGNAVFKKEKDFATYAKSATNKSSEAIGGLIFYTVTETFTYEPSYYYLEYISSNFNQVGYEYELYNNGTLVDFGFGMVNNSSRKTIDVNNSKVGNKLHIYLTNTRISGIFDTLDYAGSPNYPRTTNGETEDMQYTINSNVSIDVDMRGVGGVKVPVGSSLKVVKTTTKSEDYRFSNGANSYLENGDVVGFYRTEHIYTTEVVNVIDEKDDINTTDTDYTYVVTTVYKDGTVSVEYFKYNVFIDDRLADEDESKDKSTTITLNNNSKKFIYHNGVIYECDLIGINSYQTINTSNVTLGIGKWGTASESSRGFDVFSSFNLGGTTLENKNIVSYIYIDNNQNRNFYMDFVRRVAGQNLGLNARYYYEEPAVEYLYEIESLTQNCNYQNTVVRDNAGYSNLQKKELDVDEDFIPQENGVVSTNNFTPTTFDIKYIASSEGAQDKELLEQSGSGAGAISNIIVAANVYLGSDNIGSNTKNIIGNNYIIKMHKNAKTSSDASIFISNNNKISDLNVISNISLEDISYDKQTYSAFSSSENKGNLSNVSLYGNLRNISNNFISTVKSLSSESSKVIKVNSYVTINALNASTSGVTVKSSIKDDISNNKNYKSFNVLIAGNGANGTNGKDGLLYDSKKLDEINGTEGVAGTSGGNIQISLDKDSFKGIARAGYAGIGGYGGNGGNAISSKYKQQATAGGVGVEGKSSGANGTVSGATKIDNRAVTANTKNYSGNTGMGSFGQIYFKDSVTRYSFSSVIGSDTSDTSMVLVNSEKSSKSWTWGAQTKYDSNYTTVIGYYAKDYMNTFSNKGDYVDHSSGAIWERFHRNDRGGTMNGDITVNGGNNLGSTINKAFPNTNIYAVRKYSWDSNGVVWLRTSHAYKKVLWTGGEFVNKAVDCSLVGDKITL